MAVRAKHDTFRDFNSVGISGNCGRDATDRELFLLRVHVVVIEASRVRFRTDRATARLFVFPNPFLSGRLCHYVQFPVTILTDSFAIFSFTYTVSTLFSA